MDNRAAFEKWKEVLKIIGEFNGIGVVERFFRDISDVAYSEENETLTVYINLFCRMMIEDDYIEPFTDAVKHVFGENTRLLLEDKKNMPLQVDESAEAELDVDEETHFITSSDRRAYREMLRIRQMLYKKPEVFFGENRYAELFFRVMANFANCAEIVGLSKHISVTRNGNLIEICDCEGFFFHLNILCSEMKLFEKSDYFSYTVPGFRRNCRYSPCPFYFIANRSSNFDKCYYINSSLYLTMFMLVSLSPSVDFENVGADGSEKISYRNGRSLCKYGIKSETDKKKGSYITFEAWDELENGDICRVLERIALLVGGLKLSFTDTQKGKSVSYCYKDAGEYLSARNSFNHPCYSVAVNALGQDRYNELHYNTRVELTFNFTSSEPTAETYYNYSLLEKDNPYAAMFYEVLAEKLNASIGENFRSPVIAQDVMQFTSLVLNIRTDSDCTGWTPERKITEKKQMISDIIEDAVEKAFREWFDEVKSDAKETVGRYYRKSFKEMIDLFLKTVKELE